MVPDRLQRAHGGDEPGIVDQLRVLRRRWPLLVSAVAVGIATCGGAARLFAPVYVARAEVIYEPVTSGGVDGLEQVVAAPEGGTLDSQIRQLTTRETARTIVQRFGLAAELDEPPSLVQQGQDWLMGLVGRQAALDVPIQPVPGEPPARVLDRFMERLDGTREGKSHVFGVQWRSGDPERAAAVANAVARAFVDTRMASKVEAARRATERLDQRRNRLREAMIEARTDLEIARGAAKPTVIAAMNGAEDQFGALSRQLVDAKMDAQSRTIRAERLKDAARHGDPGLVGTDQGGSPIYQSLVALDAASAREEAELSAQYGVRHPKVIDLRNRRAELARKIAGERSQMLQKLDMEAEVARARAEGLAQQLDVVKGDAAGIAKTRQEIARLEEDSRARRIAYDTFDDKTQEIAQRLADQSPDARIVALAVAPATPAFPKPGQFMAVGGSVSLLLAGLFVWLVETRDRSVRTARELERVTDLVTVAMVPRLVKKEERERPHDVALDQPLGRFGEALRDMLAVVTAPFEHPQGRGCSVMLTSAVPDEGKTSTAIALARLAAWEGLRVVLIDGDLRHPSVLGRLGLPKGPGLQEILLGKATVEQALRTDPRSGLRILPGSALSRAALATQSGERLRQVIQSLTSDHDLVVVDAAPALAVADTKLLARSVDRVLLLARWGTTSDRLIARAAIELREVRAPLIGAVLTAVDLNRQALYGLDDRTFAYVKHARYYAT